MEIKVDIGTVKIDQNGFCLIDLDTSKKDHMDEDLATKLCEASIQACNGIPRKFITDTTNVSGSVSREAREIIRNHPELIKLRIGEAFIIKSLANRLILRVYVKFEKPLHPVKIFNNVPDAVEWLNTLEPISENK